MKEYELVNKLYDLDDVELCYLYSDLSKSEVYIDTTTKDVRFIVIEVPQYAYTFTLYEKNFFIGKIVDTIIDFLDNEAYYIDMIDDGLTSDEINDIEIFFDWWFEKYVVNRE